MAISGTHVDTFEDANHARCAEMHADADYNHSAFEVVEVNGVEVTLRSHYDGSEFTLDRKHDENGEYCEIDLESTYEMITGKPPKTFRVVPMNGERF